MINVERTYPGPECLETEKKKPSGDYKCGNVQDLLREDFYNKCYICETKEPGKINVEHFRPHRGDTDLKFDWKNLFFSCGHCNEIKGQRYNTDKYNMILDCTNSEHNVLNWLKYEMESDFPTKEVKINEVYNGTTKQKQIEAEYLKNRIQDELGKFQEIIINCNETDDEYEKKIYQRRIRKLLKKTSAFTAFKMTVVKSLRISDFTVSRIQQSGIASKERFSNPA